MTRLRFRDQRSPSRLEARFALLWRAANGPVLEKELVFHPGRRWRADFAHIPSRTLIEIEGGIWIQGRHNRAEGFLAPENRSRVAQAFGGRTALDAIFPLSCNFGGRLYGNGMTDTLPSGDEAPASRLEGLPDAAICRVQRSSEGFFNCLVKNPESCKYAFHYGNVIFCLSPERQAIEARSAAGSP